MKGRILALDVGTKRTGIAISDESQQFAFPHTQIEAKDPKKWVAQISEIVESQEVSTVLIGIPFDQYGEPGPMAEEIRKRAALLQGVEILEWDERLTTAQAERSLVSADVSRQKRKELVDKVAATILLQSYLDSLQFDHTPWKPDLQD